MPERQERLARARCPRCGRELSAYVPRHGDGTAYKVVWHKVDGEPCTGVLELVDVSDLMRTGRNPLAELRPTF